MSFSLRRASLALVFLGSTVGTLTACLPLVMGGAVVTGIVATDRRTTGSVIEDEGIELRSASRIRDNLGERAHVNVTSFNLTVLVTGEVPSEQTKTEVADAIRAIASVKNVVNELVIGGNTAYTARANDTLITTNVKTRFINNGKFSINHVKVVTESGTAFLMGIVTREEAEAATELARNTGGVSRVVKVFEYSENAGKR